MRTPFLALAILVVGLTTIPGRAAAAGGGGAGGGPTTTYYADVDGDGFGDPAVTHEVCDGCDPGPGYVANPDDCDDTKFDVNPNATEIPGDGVDQNCDGLEECFTDADGDHHGTLPTATSTSLGCDTAGVAPAKDDCNDGDAAIHPGATEIVGDDVDEDCDGHELCFTDADDDGSRLTTTVVSTDADCDDAFEGKATDPLDCDDAHASAHPGGIEVCDPGDVDEDCNGLADDADPSATGKILYYTDTDADGFGTGPGTPRCHPSGALTALVGGDCDDTDAATHPGAAEVCSDAVDNDCNGAVDCHDVGCTEDPACGPSLCSGGPFTCKNAGVTQFDLRNASSDHRDKLAFRWALGDPTTTAEFGDPTVDTRYAVCVWDDVAGVPTLVMEAIAPPAGNCVGRPCWRQLGNGAGFRYRDPGRLPNGLDQLTLRTGPLGRSSVRVQGRGVALPDAPTPFQQDPHITVQVLNGLGNCWGADYVSPALTNTSTHLSVKERP